MKNGRNYQKKGGGGRRKEKWGDGQKRKRRKGGGGGIDGRKKGRKEGESFALFLTIHNIKGYSDHEKNT